MRRRWRGMNKINKKLYNIFIIFAVWTQTCLAINENIVFIVNLESGTVICQHSLDSSDVHLHDISILCNGKQDCYKNAIIDDENFEYCGL